MLEENHYNIIYNNCEHFKSITYQVVDAMLNLTSILPYPADSPEYFTDALSQPSAQKIHNVLTNQSMKNNPNLRKPYFLIKKI
ncbi:hypothetical protein KHA89_04970 [Bacillus sp. FJAT-49731]|nr:hypothetical protein [Lederbergia citrea]